MAEQKGEHHQVRSASGAIIDHIMSAQMNLEVAKGELQRYIATTGPLETLLVADALTDCTKALSRVNTIINAGMQEIIRKNHESKSLVNATGSTLSGGF